MNRTISLTEGPILKALLRFSVPFLLANLLQALYGAVDLMVIGWFCPAESVAAVSTGTQVTQIITSLITGFTMAGTILVGKYAGMKKQKEVETSISTTITFFGVFSIFLTVILLLNISNILRLLQIPGESFDEAYRYIFICCLGIFFICEYNALSAVLRGYGDSLSPLFFVAIACVCNVAGDFLTVAVLGMGAAGMPFFRGCSFDYLAVSFLFCLNGYLNGHKKTLFTMLNCCAGALLIRVPVLFLLVHAGISNLRIYGLVSPASSLVMIGVIGIYGIIHRSRQSPVPAALSGPPCQTAENLRKT